MGITAFTTVDVVTVTLEAVVRPDAHTVAFTVAVTVTEALPPVGSVTVTVKVPVASVAAPEAGVKT